MHFISIFNFINYIFFEYFLILDYLNLIICIEYFCINFLLIFFFNIFKLIYEDYHHHFIIQNIF